MKQGDAMSLFFKHMLENVVEKDIVLEQGEKILLLGYVDDLDMSQTDKQSVVSNIDKLIEASNKVSPYKTLMYQLSGKI